MRLLRWELQSIDETIARFKKTRLRGFGRPYIFENAQLELIKHVQPQSLMPTQRYVLKNDLNCILALDEMFRQRGINIFALEGALLFWIERDGEEEGPIPLTPPIVEESLEADGKVVRLINDGMHRVAAARHKGVPINIILAKGVPSEYPYYAYPMEDGWDSLVLLDELPDGFQKKEYRMPDNYKSLFRDFNEVFSGIQKQRKQSNPAHIKE